MVKFALSYLIRYAETRPSPLSYLTPTPTKTAAPDHRRRLRPRWDTLRARPPQRRTATGRARRPATARAVRAAPRRRRRLAAAPHRVVISHRSRLGTRRLGRLGPTPLPPPPQQLAPRLAAAAWGGTRRARRAPRRRRAAAVGGKGGRCTRRARRAEGRLGAEGVAEGLIQLEGAASLLTLG